MSRTGRRLLRLERRPWILALLAGAGITLLVPSTLALYGSSLGQPFTSDDYQYLHGCQRLGGASLLSVFHPSVQGVVLLVGLATAGYLAVVVATKLPELAGSFHPSRNS